MDNNPRRGMRYWGPVLIVIGVTLAGLAWFAWQGVVLYWCLAISAAFVLFGVTLVGAARLDDEPKTPAKGRP